MNAKQIVTAAARRVADSIHGCGVANCSACKLSAIESIIREFAWIEGLIDAAQDLFNLATMLDDDDPYYGEQRNAEARLAKAKATLTAIPRGEGKDD